MTSLDREAQRVGMKFIILKEISSAISKIAEGSFAFYENIYFLQNARVKLWWEPNKNNITGTVLQMFPSITVKIQLFIRD